MLGVPGIDNMAKDQRSLILRVGITQCVQCDPLFYVLLCYQHFFLPSVGYKLDEMAPQYIARWFKYSLVGLLS